MKPTERPSQPLQNSEEVVPSHEPGVYLAKYYWDGPIEERAIHCVRKICVVESEIESEEKQQEDHVRSAELDFMLGLET